MSDSKKKILLKEKGINSFYLIYFFILVIIIIILCVIFINIIKQKQNLTEKTQLDDNLLNKTFVNIDIILYSNILNIGINIIKNKIKDKLIKNKEKNTILSPKNKENKYFKSLEKLLFVYCLNTNISYDMENYYNFNLNKKINNIEIDYYNSEDVKISYNNICFSSGKIQIGLKTSNIPKCIDFISPQISNFILINDTIKDEINEIKIKFNLFKINHKENKVHIFPIKNYYISNKLIKLYYEMTEDIFINNDILFYFNDKQQKVIRICNIFEGFEKDFYIYKNKFWLKLQWNSNIQNFICMKNLKFIN